MLKELWTEPLGAANTAQINLALFAGRILAVIGLIPNGLRKIATFEQTALGMGGTPQLINGRPFPDQTPLFYFPAPELFLGVSVTLDLLGAVLVILGVRARLVGALLCGYVIVAMTIFHSDLRHAQDVTHLIRNLPFVAALMILSAAGPGRWSLDGWRARSRDI